MKLKNIYLLLLLVLLFSCTNNKSKEEKTTTKDTVLIKDTLHVRSSVGAKQQLVGTWKEHWGIGMETNVQTSDVFKIQLNANDNLTISCPDKKKFAIDQILFDGKELTFRKQNKSYPKGKFYVYYRLKLNDNAQWMEGPITNNKKQKDYVKWEKMNVSE